MPVWRTTEQILNLGNEGYGDVFEINWLNYEKIEQYMPEKIFWNSNRKIRFEDVEIWEVIAEVSGPIGVYAAWNPYFPYFIVINRWRLYKEFWGIKGEKELQKYLKDVGIHFNINEIWIDEEEFEKYINPEPNTTIIL